MPFLTEKQHAAYCLVDKRGIKQKTPEMMGITRVSLARLLNRARKAVAEIRLQLESVGCDPKVTEGIIQNLHVQDSSRRPKNRLALQLRSLASIP